MDRSKTVERNVVHDALTGSALAIDGHGCALLDEAERTHAHTAVRSLFFPGCSIVNFAVPLMRKAYATLEEAGMADGISLLCCGKLLAFEPDAKAVRTAFEADLRDALVESGVERIVAACPNCTVELRRILLCDERTAAISVEVLPEVLASAGASLDERAVERFFADNHMAVSGTVPRLAVHDSCPDRATGEFACGTRSLLPATLLVEMEHARALSLCCGSLAKAAGKADVATRQAIRRGEEGADAGADAIVTACMSCASQLSRFQSELPAIHYLELLYNERLAWDELPPYLQVRFLFEDHAGKRDFRGLGEMGTDLCGGCCAPCETDQRDGG